MNDARNPISTKSPALSRLLDLWAALAAAVAEVASEATALAADPTSPAAGLVAAIERRDALAMETGFAALRCPELFVDPIDDPAADGRLDPVAARSPARAAPWAPSEAADRAPTRAPGEHAPRPAPKVRLLEHPAPAQPSRAADAPPALQVEIARPPATARLEASPVAPAPTDRVDPPAPAQPIPSTYAPAPSQAESAAPPPHARPDAGRAHPEVAPAPTAPADPRTAANAPTPIPATAPADPRTELESPPRTAGPRTELESPPRTAPAAPRTEPKSPSSNPATARPAAPPSPASLASLKDHFSSAREPSPEPAKVRIAVVSTQADVQRFAQAIGQPLPVVDAPAEIERLRAAVRELDAWLALPQHLQRDLLAWTAARARAVQDAADAASHLDSVFSRLTDWSKTHQPGSVHGLARAHLPRHGSWHEDAKRCWKKLGLDLPPLPVAPAPPGLGLEAVKAALTDTNDGALRDLVVLALRHTPADTLACALQGHGERLVGDSRLKPLRKKIKALEVERASREAAARPRADAAKTAKPAKAPSRPARTPAPAVDPVPADWPGFALTRDSAALVVGGDRSSRLEGQLRELLGCSRVDVVTGDKPRQVQSATERIGRGTYDLVFIIKRFNAHKTTDRVLAACKGDRPRVLHVENGLGLQQFMLAVEAAAARD